MKKILSYLLMFTLILSGCSTNAPKIEGTQIKLSDKQITVDGKKITSDSTQPVYAFNDIVFYRTGQDFTYGEGTTDDEHEQSEADEHTVVHITKPGRYVLNGKLTLGQIAVDLGEEAENDPNAVVTLILNGVDITCSVAPAIIFYNVYESCSNDEETATKDVDTTKAGANVIIADGTENNVNGSYVAKIYKSYELNDEGTEVVDSKKLHKYDAAFYSKKTLNINGQEKSDGILNIKAENEGLDSELHLTINGGIINIISGNDGINTNEDNVSVTTINGGKLNILCNGATGEGDGIDSNGWLVINGGTVIAQACAISGDAGIDSDKGIFINGGEVMVSGNMLDPIAGGNQTYAVFNFASRNNENVTYTLKNVSEEVVFEYTSVNAFTYLVIAGDKLVSSDYTLWAGNIQLAANKIQNMQGASPEMSNGEQFQQGISPELPERMDRPTPPNGEVPQLPNGEMPKPDNLEIPQGMEHPNNIDIPKNDMMQNSEPSTIFTITKGGNQFINVNVVKQ